MCSVKKVLLKDFAKFTAKKPVPESLFNKVTDLKLLRKKGLPHRCFPVNFTKFLEYLFYRTLSLTASDFTYHCIISTKFVETSQIKSFP